MTTSRRSALKAGIGALSTVLIPACGTGRYRGPDRAITIASGQPGGLYVEFAKLLANQISAANPGLRCSAMETAGSVINVAMINAGVVDLAMSQADVALAALTAQHPFTAKLAMSSIGRVYEDYLQLVVPAASSLNRLADLAGRRVSIGAFGSGTATISQRLLDITGLEVVGLVQKLGEAVLALETGQVDALLWSGGVPTPALDQLHRRIRIRVLAITELSALRSRYGTAYQQVNLPVGGYDQAGVATLGVANLLLCRQNLPDDVAAAVTHTLVERATQLVPHQALGTQFLDPNMLINTLTIPKHPGAKNAYRELHG